MQYDISTLTLKYRRCDMKNFEVYLKKDGKIVGNYEINDLQELSGFLHGNIYIDCIIFNSNILERYLCWDVESGDSLESGKNLDIVENQILLRLGKEFILQSNIKGI